MISSKRSKADFKSHFSLIYSNWGDQNDIKGVSITYIASI